MGPGALSLCSYLWYYTMSDIILATSAFDTLVRLGADDVIISRRPPSLRLEGQSNCRAHARSLISRLKCTQTTIYIPSHLSQQVVRLLHTQKTSTSRWMPVPTLELLQVHKSSPSGASTR